MLLAVHEAHAGISIRKARGVLIAQPDFPLIRDHQRPQAPSGPSRATQRHGINELPPAQV